MIKTGSDFSGVGAFDQALERLGIKQNKIFACDMDKYARQTYIHNYGEPKYYPENVYDREIPKESLDIYMTSPPCQGFSIAGQRGGSILFLNSYEFIKVNKPRYFIFENVKGLLSHEKKNKDDTYGNTFNQWLNYLGGKSVNGNPVIFPHEESVPYHIYHKVINAKKCGVPQNRERVFIIGIRDDVDNTFTWSKDIPLEKRLKDVLEDNVDEKYYLSDKMLKGLVSSGSEWDKTFQPHTENDISKCLTARYFKMGRTDPYLKVKSATKIGAIRGRGEKGEIKQNLEISQDGYSNALTTVQKDNVVVTSGIIVHGGSQDNCAKMVDISPCLTSAMGLGGGHVPRMVNYQIRRLTPTECFRLMDFNPSFKWNVSDTQAYKQAGNSIVVSCLVGIIKKLNL